MPLRVCDRRVRGIDHAVAVQVLDVVILRIRHLARRDPARVIPPHPVVRGGRLHPRLHEVIPAAQQAQFLLQQRPHLPGKGKTRRRNAVLRARRRRGRYRGVRRVRRGLVPHDRIQVVEITRHQEQRVVRRPIINPSVDAQVPCPTRHRLVDLDQPKLVDVRKVQRDRTLPTPSRLRQRAHIRVDRVVVQVLDPLLERVDPRQHPLHPALRQLRLRPCRPLAQHRVRAPRQPVPHHQVIVCQHLHARAAQGEPRQPRPGLGVEPLAHVALGRRHAIHRRPNLPFVLKLPLPPAQVRRVLQREQLIQRILGRHHPQLPSPQRPAHAEHMHRHRLARVRECPPVPDHQGHITHPGAHRAHRIRVHRRVVARDLSHITNPSRHGEARVHDELPGRLLGLHEGLHLRGQPVHKVVPLGLLVGRRRRAHVQHPLQVLLRPKATQHVDPQVFPGRNVPGLLAHKDQGSLGTHVGIEVHPVRQMRRQVGEVELPLISLRQHAWRQGTQPKVHQRRRLGTGRIDQYHARRLRREVRPDGLLVQDLRAGLALQVRQASDWPHQGLPHLHQRRNRRPRRAIDNG